MIQVNTNGALTQDYEMLDAIIDMETARKISRVEGAENFGIRTACIIDGEFVLVSDYNLPDEIRAKLEKA